MTSWERAELATAKGPRQGVDVLRRGAAAAAQDRRAEVAPLARLVEVARRRVLVGEQPLRRVEPPDVRVDAGRGRAVRRQRREPAQAVLRRRAVQQDRVRPQRRERGRGLRQRLAGEERAVLVRDERDPGRYPDLVGGLERDDRLLDRVDGLDQDQVAAGVGQDTDQLTVLGRGL